MFDTARRVQPRRSPIDGNLAAARATASKINGQLEEGQRSMFSFQKITPKRFVDQFVAYVRDVQQLAWRTVERYRAALQRFVDFAEPDGDIATIDQVEEATIQNFVAWLRGQLRTRNGAVVRVRWPRTLVHRLCNAATVSEIPFNRKND